MAEDNGGTVDLGALGSFDFTPDWAKGGSKVSVAGGGGGGGSRPQAERRPFPQKGGEPRDRKPVQQRRPRFEERPRPLDCDVKVLPESKALGTIFRKLKADAHAFKLKDLAYFLLDNPESVTLKVTPRDGQSFFQCKACGFASTSREDVEGHVLAAHLGDYYDSKEVECEPPKGNFNCVAKCGLSGVLLGPPNIHEFNSTVREMIRTRYPGMSESQYRAHIEMVHDKEAIEAWRSGAVKKTAFFPKSSADAAPSMTRDQAEGEFRRTIMPSIVEEQKTLSLTAAIALKSPCRPLAMAAENALMAERRAPYGVIYALRGAFHHRKLNFFRANDPHGPEFVTNVEYRRFDADHAIPELAFAAKFIADNPCCDKSEFPKDVADFEKHVSWLVATGHVVAFTNGVYSEVEKHPKYGPQWKKRRAAPARAEEVAKAPEPQEAPVVPEQQATPTAPESPVAPEEQVAPEPPQDAQVPQTPEVPEAGKEDVKDETAAQLA